MLRPLYNFQPYVSEVTNHLGRSVDDLLKRTTRLFTHYLVWCLCSVSAFYFTGSLFSATLKVFFYDELLTFYIARLPSISQIWRSLGSGADLHPPLYFILARISHSALGPSELSTRLPSIIGFWVMCLSLFEFARRRLSLQSALVALLFPLITATFTEEGRLTGAASFALEGRPYAVVLGCCGFALLCWQLSTDRQKRLIPLIGLSLSLFIAVASHYLAVLMLFPLIAGELVRSLYLKKLDRSIWSAFAVGLLPIFLLSPLIAVGSRYVAQRALGAGIHPSFGSLIRFYEFLLMPASVPLLAGIVGAVLYRELTSAPLDFSEDTKAFQVWELVVAIGLLGVPIIGMALSITITHSFTPRFFLVALVGLDLLIALAAQRAAAGRPSIGTALVIILVTSFVVSDVRLWRQFYVKRSLHSKMMKSIELDGSSDLPILVEDQVQYIELFYYAPPTLRARLHVINGVMEYAILSHCYPIKQDSLNSFLQKNPTFLMLWNQGSRALPLQLAGYNKEIHVVSAIESPVWRNRYGLLFLVTTK